MTDRTPTDPAPRGADAPRQRELTALYARVQNVVEKHIEPVADQEEVLVAVTMYVRAIESLRSPVPAEATSGAVTPGPFTRAIREQALNLIDECVAVHGEEAAQSRGHERGCWFLRYADALTTLCEDEEDRLAALRTPPAPLPREGATKPEPFSAEVRGWTTHDSPLSVRYHGEALDLLTLFIEASPLPLNGGPARRTTVRRRDLLAALTPAAPTTTKETR